MSTLNDDEQLESLKSFTKKYGSAIMTGILIALIAFFGWQYWQKKNLLENQNRTAEYQKLLEQSTKIQDDAGYKSFISEVDSLVKTHPDSAQAVQAELLMASQAVERNDYAAAEKALLRVENTAVKDEGLKHLIWLRLAYIQTELKKYDAALKNLDRIKDENFIATAQEARGDIFVAQNKTDLAKAEYQKAWDALIARQQERKILQLKLQSVGVLVEDPNLDSPIVKTQTDEG